MLSEQEIAENLKDAGCSAYETGRILACLKIVIIFLSVRKEEDRRQEIRHKSKRLTIVKKYLDSMILLQSFITFLLIWSSFPSFCPSARNAFPWQSQESLQRTDFE